jgi:hypothetical protein
VVDCLRGEDSNKDRLVPNYVRKLSDDDTAQRQSSVVPKVAESRVEQRNVVRSSRDPANSRRRDGRCLSSREFPVFGTLGRTCHSQFRRFVWASSEVEFAILFQCRSLLLGCACVEESLQRNRIVQCRRQLWENRRLSQIVVPWKICPPAK